MARILVVDDEETIVELISFNLEKEGFIVDTATDGQEALLKIATKKPDLIVLDWMLPGLDGLDICRRIRQNPDTTDIPVIMLTARGEEVDRILGLELGASDYVTKPFSPRELAARVKAQLRARQIKPALQEERSRIVRQGNLSLDLDRYLVQKDGKTLDLPPKEFELLFLLISHPGRVFRRVDILNKVWGYDYVADTRTVDVHIRYLRQKVEEDPRNPVLLLTVRGIGYKFKEPDR
ncbi:MAG: Alkaline phosphatase synthesis transcriptional regulatory protein PhoP [Dehalococcoidia bacterium]|nr:Alkaline phosphatase synthesis transcriptional regulatory protein PhoP [Bacillota bacterium]MBT9142377.1 Alkaline phosphatase synthesis transcriptional regulatory protein PhoP [Bacillota bacterium]